MPIIVVEGEDDAAILRWGLPKSLFGGEDPAAIRVAGGRFTALSAGRTFISTMYQPVLVIADADTADASKATAELNGWKGALMEASPGIPCDVYFAVPDLAASFFQEPFLGQVLSTHATLIGEDLCGGTTGGSAREFTALLGAHSMADALSMLQGSHPASVWRKTPIARDVIALTKALVLASGQAAAHKHH